MRIALAQINSSLGDFKANAQKILDFSRRAKEKRADLVIFPEMALFGYPPGDMLERADFVGAQLKVLEGLVSKIPPQITVIFGAVVKNKSAQKRGGKPYHNAAVVARRGKSTQFFAKQLLPSYDVFEDTRFFEPGVKTGIVTVPNIGNVAVTICEDMWANFARESGSVYARDPILNTYSKDPLRALKKISLVVNISASPFSLAKVKNRMFTAREHVRRLKVPFAYVNQIGGQDEIIFDGRSFVLDKDGTEIVQAASCEEDLVIIDLKKRRSEFRPKEQNKQGQIREALVLGLRDFLKKTTQKFVHLGLSGGIDSSLVAAIAVDALGAANVTGILLPGPFSSEGSVTHALELAKNLKIKTESFSISESYHLFQKSVLAIVAAAPRKNIEIMNQNIQSRFRALVLMSYANATNSMLLTTANKSELAAGFGTMYGDLCGGLAPIGDLLKNEVYELSKYYNSEKNIIPSAVLTKAPSAELAPDQKDSDSLPPYDQLDSAVQKLVEGKFKASSVVEKSAFAMILKSEWKRWQTPPVLKVKERSFGKGRHMPIAGKFS